MKTRQPVKLAPPAYCPWCGADVAAHGHDDNCPKPPACVMIVAGEGKLPGFVAVP